MVIVRTGLKVLGKRIKLAIDIKLPLKLVIVRIRPIMVIGRIELKVIGRITVELVIQHTKLIIAKLLIKVSEQFIFQLPNIQLFLKLFLMGYTRHIYLRKLKERIQFSILQHNNQ
jgi:hypothetical protein